MCACLGAGRAYKEDNQIQAAFGYYEKALEIAKEQEDKEREIIVRGTIIELSSMRGKIENGIIAM